MWRHVAGREGCTCTHYLLLWSVLLQKLVETVWDCFLFHTKAWRLSCFGSVRASCEVTRIGWVSHTLFATQRFTVVMTTAPDCTELQQEVG